MASILQGEGGILEASEPFLRALRKRCDEVGALLIFDEIQVRSYRPLVTSRRVSAGARADVLCVSQCGLGRTGGLWAHSNLPVDCHPDILTMAKPLANVRPLSSPKALLLTSL